MRLRTFFGWCTIIIMSLLPAVAWYFLRPVHAGLSLFADVTHSLGQLTALIGMTLFALTLLLSARVRFIEDIFGGLDKVYVVHSILGSTALILILFHPIFLVLKYLPQNVDIAARYLLPSSHWSVNFGIIALLGLIALVYVTLYTKIKYNNWKVSHKFLGVLFIFAVFHIFLVRGDASRDNIFAGYYVYAAVVSFIGLGSFLFTLLVKSTGLNEAIYTIEAIDKKKQGVMQLALAPVYKPIKYKSGQFVFLRFYNEALTRESHPFSIISKSDDTQIKVLIKELGDFTSRLHQLNVGDRVAIEGPYGRFGSSGNENCDQIWIAAGIGITPFVGMAEDLRQGMKCRVDLYHSVRNKEDFISYEHLKSIERAAHGRFRFIPWVSSEMGRIGVKDVYKKSNGFTNKEFYLCGPTGFKSELRKSLVEFGVPRSKIHEEDFSFR
jgi:predicted ferric reductase